VEEDQGGHFWRKDSSNDGGKDGGTNSSTHKDTILSHIRTQYYHIYGHYTITYKDTILSFPPSLPLNDGGKGSKKENTRKRTLLAFGPSRVSL
jgi:hypothetical protein